MSAVIRAVRRRLGKPAAKPGKALGEGAIDVREALAFLPPDPVVVEAGAYDGSDTVKMGKLWPNGTVHAFEPNPAVFHRLREQTEGFGNVRLYESALGTLTGTVPMWVSESREASSSPRARDASSSLRAPKEHLEVFQHVAFDNQVHVASTTLNEWAQREGVDGVDFLWLDMQGYELAALQHGLAVLGSVRAIILEIFTRELYEGAPLWPEVRDWLEGQGFSVVRTRINKRGFGDALLKR